MPKSISLGNGVWLQTQICDASNEVSSTSRKATGLYNRLDVAWRNSSVKAEIKVTHDIVQGQHVVSYTHNGGAQWEERFSRVQYGQPRWVQKGLTVADDGAQVVFDCATVAVHDIWLNSWVHVSTGLQLTLQVS
jgi:hypothetical protein